MRKVFYLFFLSVIMLQAQNYIDIYRQNGIKEVQKIFDKKLQEMPYWLDYLKDYNTTYGYFEKKKFLIVANKTDKKLDLFIANGKGNLKKIFTKNIITGKNGEKKKEGDLVTPLGTYKITMRFKPKDSFYGPVAFAISYPNLYDKLNGRDGHGIWIHGYPLDHEKRPPVTKGCMVLKNEQLLDLNRTIDPQNSFVIIYENSLKPVKKETIAKILTFLYQWKDAWKRSDIKKYLSFYDKDFKRYDGKNLKYFSNYKKIVFSRKEKKKIIFKNIFILPYPNLKNEQIYEIFFYEKYKSKHYAYNGNKNLFIRIKDGSIKIIVEK